MRDLPTLALALAVSACGGDDDTAVPDAADRPPADTAAARDGADLPPADSARDDAADPCAGGRDSLRRLPPADFAALVAANPILINVHVPRAGEIAGTDAHIPYTEVAAIEAFVAGDRCAEIALYCRSGPMSVDAGEELARRGYRRVSDLQGGMNAWRDAGYPLEP